MTTDDSNARLAIRARLVKIFAWAYVAITMVQLVATGYVLFRPREIVVTPTGTEPGTPPDVIVGLVIGFASLVLVLVTLALVVASLVWVHRAHSALRERGVPLDHSPGWAVGSYFVPFANLVIPFRAMRELYNRSHGEVEELAHTPVDDVFAWWAVYILGLTLWLLLAFKTLVDQLTSIVFLTPAWAEFTLGALTALLLALACYLLTKLVSTITAAQGGSAHVASTFA